MLRFIHISDLHFTAGISGDDESRSLLKKVRPFIDEGAHLIVTGDIVDDGEGKQFKVATSALKPFQGHLLIVPGNHDAADDGHDYSRQRELHLEQQLLKPLGLNHSFVDKDPLVEEYSDGQGTNVLAIGLNSIRQTPGRADLAVGELGKKQLEALDKRLDNPEYATHWRLVYLHHHPTMKTIITPGMRLIDGDDLLKVVNGRVDVLAVGHEGGTVHKATLKGNIPRLDVETKSRPYYSNANCSVHWQQCVQIEFEGPRIATGHPKSLRVKVWPPMG